MKNMNIAARPRRRIQPSIPRGFFLYPFFLWASLLFALPGLRAQENLLKNPGFEEQGANTPPGWSSREDNQGQVTVANKEAHLGRQCAAIPAHSALEQSIPHAKPGAYIARCWVKSDAEQKVTCLLQDPFRPWAVYTYVDTLVPKDQWTQIEIACAMDREGTLTLTLGGLSAEFCLYHGTTAEMAAPILADDFELIHYVPKTLETVAIWDMKKDLSEAPDWAGKGQWTAANDQGITGSPVFQAGQLSGFVRKADGAIALFVSQDKSMQPRGVILPSPAFVVSACTMVVSNRQTGIHIEGKDGSASYTAWLTSSGLIRIEPGKTPRFQVRDCRMSYGLLPSFAGTDICYAPGKMPSIDQINIPSTQWYVGLVEGNSSMMVAVWDAPSQSVSLGLSGQGDKRIINSLTLGTETGGFSVSFIEHADIWHREPLMEDWLGEYAAISWKRPFPARWMGQFFVKAEGEPSFQEPRMDYSFPIANTKTRMWGVWFEDWNRYPFYFDGPRTMVHFEKSFVPNGDAFFYFLEPAVADLYSPCEIVEQALGKEKAASLFDFDANRLRKLSYSTPSQFMYDRPVCATTTRLSKIKKEDKPTIGVNLATHLYEFIREIRGRVDQYSAFFAQTKEYFHREKAAHPETGPYIAELEKMIDEAQSKAKSVYATPLPDVKTKIEAMKGLLHKGQGDGFDCGNLDVRGPAGAQDDLCRRYNRLVLRLAQTAALTCGDSSEKTAIATYLLDQSKKVLREPTRWEPRRTLYFSEP